MNIENRWLLPEGVEEILPPKAARLERLCREIIDLYARWGYELVIPPMIEYLESLLTGTGKDLDLQTFKITDQLSGRTMGIRADMTPQVARIDAHILKRNVPTRLCYLGSVLHARPESSGGSRSPLQVGAELYGHSGVASDTEVMSLMLETLKLAGINNLYIDIGHVGIYQSLVVAAGLNTEQESVLFDALQRKASAELQQMFNDWNTEKKISDLFFELIKLNGNQDVLQKAKALIGVNDPNIIRCIEELEQITSLVGKRADNVIINYDLAELRGYHYHTGFMFTAYSPGQGEGIAFGGRYDDIGAAFGRARPATGFSTDVKTLLALQKNSQQLTTAIFAPCDDDKTLSEKIDTLRAQGEVVVCALPDQTGGAKEMNCARKLEKKGNTWEIVDV